MSRLPVQIARSLQSVASPGKGAAEVLKAVKEILEAESRFDELARAFEAFRESIRSLGILDESRSGERLNDGWMKLSHFFLESVLRDGDDLLSGEGDLEDAPAGFEPLAAWWARAVPELRAFVDEEKDLDRALAGAPVSALVTYRLRSRFLLLDRRAERVKVAADLIRRGLAAAARDGIDLALGQAGTRSPRAARVVAARKGAGP
jgi:hypothetical protein